MKKMKMRTSIVLGVVVWVLYGCSGSGSQGGGLVMSSGRAGEVLVVCANKQWQGELGDSLQAILMQPVLILPQEESLFLLSHVAPQHFKDAFQKQRNILILSIDTLLEKGTMSITHNQWAKDQMVMRITANSLPHLIDEVSNRQTRIIDRLMNREMSRFLQAQKCRQDFRLSREVEKKYKISLVIPNGFVFAVKDSNFCWLRGDTKDWTQSIMVYMQDYVHVKQFSGDYILRLRDSLTKQYVFGAADSSYITTDKKYFPPISEPTAAFGGSYAVRTVGLWRAEGDFMGGPFVNFTLLDTSKNRIITLDAFLYAPNDKKRDYLRQIEAILLHVKLLDK